MKRPRCDQYWTIWLLLCVSRSFSVKVPPAIMSLSKSFRIAMHGLSCADVYHPGESCMQMHLTDMKRLLPALCTYFVPLVFVRHLFNDFYIIVCIDENTTRLCVSRFLCCAIWKILDGPTLRMHCICMCESFAGFSWPAWWRRPDSV